METIKKLIQNYLKNRAIKKAMKELQKTADQYKEDQRLKRTIVHAEKIRKSRELVAKMRHARGDFNIITK